ncbi:unnamed protein product [Closterium sp. NIES-64]|nr:unnamed protein product [Closterium sp. NIES-64]
MPRSWPRGKEARDAECKGHMEKLAVMFHARDRDEILPEKRDHHHAAEEGDDDAVDSGRDNAEDDASEDDQVEAEDDDEGY